MIVSSVSGRLLVLFLRGNHNNSDYGPQCFDTSRIGVPMALRRGSPLACSINMRGGARGGLTPYTPPCETLATTSSRSNSETLAVHLVLAHPRAVFHPYTCGLPGGAAAVKVALIGYDNIKVAAETTTGRRRS
jgi:hypothetical protein